MQTTGPWLLPLTTDAPSTTPDTLDIVWATAHYQLRMKIELTKYLHKCTCSPVTSTWN